MIDPSSIHWRTLSGQSITEGLRTRLDEAIRREKEAGHKLKVCIGTDSQVKGKDIGYACVIVILREGKGGFMFIHSGQFMPGISLKERMIEEVNVSVQVAYSICDILDRQDVELEVHADINTDPGFKSHVALREAMGYIRGMGFIFKAKPNAFASSYCADKLV